MNSKAYKSYEIGKYEYLELKYFCLRHEEKKRVINQARREKFDTLPIYVKKYYEDVTLVEHALKLSTSNAVIRNCLLRAVTNNISYEQLYIPMGRRQFYELRRKFFYTLKNLKDNSP